MSIADHPLRATIEAAFADRSLLADPKVVAAVEETIALLDRGVLRVAEPPSAAAGADGDEGEWTVHAWTKQAILLYFGIRKMEPS